MSDAIEILIGQKNEALAERDALAKRVEELTRQRDSAFDTANTARALLSRVEELEKLLGDAGEAEATFQAFLLTAHALYPSSHPDYYGEQSKVAETRCAVWSEQRRIAERRAGRT